MVFISEAVDVYHLYGMCWNFAKLFPNVPISMREDEEMLISNLVWIWSVRPNRERANQFELSFCHLGYIWIAQLSVVNNNEYLCVQNYVQSLCSNCKMAECFPDMSRCCSIEQV